MAALTEGDRFGHAEHSSLSSLSSPGSHAGSAPLLERTLLAPGCSERATSSTAVHGTAVVFAVTNCEGPKSVDLGPLVGRIHRFAIRCLSHLAMPPIGTEEHTRHAAGVNDGAALLGNTFSGGTFGGPARDSGRSPAPSSGSAFGSPASAPLPVDSHELAPFRTESRTDCCRFCCRFSGARFASVPVAWTS